MLASTISGTEGSMAVARAESGSASPGTPTISTSASHSSTCRDLSNSMALFRHRHNSVDSVYHLDASLSALLIAAFLKASNQLRYRAQRSE